MSEIEFPPASKILRDELVRIGWTPEEAASIRVVFDDTPIRPLSADVAREWAAKGQPR